MNAECYLFVFFWQDGEIEPILWAVLHQWQTRIVKGSHNLLFGDQFSCILQENKELHQISLKMEVVTPNP